MFIKLCIGIFSGAFGILFIAAPACYVFFVEKEDMKSLINKINSKSVPTVLFDEYVERNGFENDLKTMLTPKVRVDSFFVVIGENGTGKTSLVQKVCHSLDGGVLYVDVPANISMFATDFAAAIGYVHREHDGFWSWIHSMVYNHDKLPGKVNFVIILIIKVLLGTECFSNLN